jgi:hypothetical protein
MPQITLRFNINPDGSVQEIVEGISGHSCDLLTKPIEQSLGEVEQRTHTPAFYAKINSIQNKYIEYLEDHDWI